MTYGSSLGPSIQAIMACRLGKVRPTPTRHFMRAARADLRDVRGNAGDGIHGAIGRRGLAGGRLRFWRPARQ